jgi:hypothetical protein
MTPGNGGANIVNADELSMEAVRARARVPSSACAGSRA